MNCAQHPAAEVVAYCQQCGKPLCTECLRSVGGVIHCEPCLGARLGIPVGEQAVNGVYPMRQPPNPALAGLLGLIPGVGAMYNGQLVKALAHVLIFAVFVSLADKSVIFALLVPAWVLYQVFDAYQTAYARLEGLPLPNPFGLNDLGAHLRVPQTPHPEAAPQAGARTPVPPLFVDPMPTGPAVSQYPPERGREPVGAIVLIVIGLVLLLHTLGIFRGEWIGRGWPLLIIGLGAWLLYRRAREAGGGGPR